MDERNRQRDVLLQNADFESYKPYIALNTFNGGNDFASGRYLPDLGWSSDVGDIHFAMSLNYPWGGAPAASGEVYAILQFQSNIFQTVSGLKSGENCQLFWSQQGRPGAWSFNDMHVQVNGRTVFTDPLVVNTRFWTRQISDLFQVNGSSVEIRFYTMNPLGNDNSVFIDNVSLVCNDGNLAQS